MIMDMPCSVSFEHGVQLKGYKTIEEALNCDSSIIYENKEIILYFNSTDKNSRLYASMLKNYDVEGMLEDGGQVYFKPSDKGHSIINYSKKRNVPLIPGKYYFEYHSGDTVVYYPFTVINNQNTMSTPIWEQMRRDIEEFSKELTLQYTKGDNSVIEIDEQENMFNTNNIMSKIYYLVTHQTKIMQQLYDISRLNAVEIKKDYQWLPEYKSGYEDIHTIQMKHKKPNYTKVYTKKNILTFDTLYNRGLKFCLNYLYYFCTQIEIIINNHVSKLQREYDADRLFLEHRNHQSQKKNRQRVLKDQLQEFQIIQSEINKLKNTVTYVINECWIKNVTTIYQLQPTKKMMLNPQYNFFYKLYKLLSNSDNDLKMAREYKVQLKPSHELYEIWCFIYLIKLLRKIGFEPYDGWIFNSKHEIPYLLDGDYLCLKKDNIYLKLVYNEVIHSTKVSEASEKNPFYTRQKRNHPDIRLDIYENDLSYENYRKSIIFDAKYKNGKTVFALDEKQNDFSRSDTYNQLSNYQEGIRHLMTREQCVYAAVAMYPSNNRLRFEENRLLQEYRKEWRGFRIDAFKVSPLIEESDESVNEEFKNWIIENINLIVREDNRLKMERGNING